MKVFTALLRIVVQESFSHAWKPNDAFDLMHSIVPLVCSDVIFLDKHWKRRVQRLPRDLVPEHIYYANEFRRFFDYLETQ